MVAARASESIRAALEAQPDSTTHKKLAMSVRILGLRRACCEKSIFISFGLRTQA